LQFFVYQEKDIAKRRSYILFLTVIFYYLCVYFLLNRIWQF